MKNKWNPEELRERAQKIREALKPKSITPEMVGGTLHDLVDGVKEVEQSLQERTDHAIRELQRIGAATPRFSGHIVESDIDYDDERMFMGSAQHTSTDPGCAVVFIRSLGIFALRVLEGATVTLAEMATANGPSGVSPSPGIVDPGMWSPGSDDEPLYQSVKFYLNWADATDMGMHLGETGYEPVPRVMYMCTLSPYGFMRFESADDSAGFPYEAIRMQLMGDSEEVVIRNNSAILSEKAKMKLFVDRWKTRLKEFCDNETFELDMANTLEDGSQFGLNGLMLSYDEAQMIEALALPYFAKSGEMLYNDTNLTKTLFPVAVRSYYSCQQMFCWNTKLVALSMYPDTVPSIVGQMFAVCRNLEIIYGILNVAYVTNAANATYCFQMCYKLHTVKVKGLKVNFSFVDCPLISLESLLYCVENAINTSAITITVHPNVFAKLTGDTSNAAAAELSDDELTAWGELATLAVSKNISFAS